MLMTVWVVALLAAGDAGGLPPEHPPVAGGAAQMPSADEVMQKLDASADLKSKPKTFEIASAMGRLYYAHGRFRESIAFLQEADQKAEGLRTLAAAQKRRAGAGYTTAAPAKADACGWTEGAGLEDVTAAVRAKVGGTDAAQGAACVRAALKPVQEIELLEAQARFLEKDAAGALLTLNRVLELAPDAHEAVFARGYVLLDAKGDDPASLRKAQADFERYLSLAPGAVRADEARRLSARAKDAAAAGGVSALDKKRLASPVSVASPAPAGTPPALTQEMVDAVQNTERTPELEQGLAGLVDQGEQHLVHGRYQEALDAYKRVVPFEPNNGRAKAGMAWALVGLNRQPMAERIWQVAVSSDAAAVDRLGDALKAQGNVKDATALWTKLAQSDSAYAAKAQLSSKLK